MTNWEELKPRLAQSAFRSKFKLHAAELRYIAEKGLPAVEKQCRDFVVSRLAVAEPDNDGRQTPWKGHPCFVAQHATGACCRGCLEKWQGIPRGRPMNEREAASVTANLMHWIGEHSEGVENLPHTPELGLEF